VSAHLGTTMMLSCHFQAPELLLSPTCYDGKGADVWAAGVLLYTLLCGAWLAYSLQAIRCSSCCQALKDRVKTEYRQSDCHTAGSFPFWRDEDDAAPQDPASRLRCMALRIVKVGNAQRLACCALLTVQKLTRLLLHPPSAVHC
jgi:hypothetical protein